MPLPKRKPGAPLRLGVVSRDALRGAALELLAQPGYISDVCNVLDDFDSAGRRGLVTGVFRMLDDLGWDADDCQSRVELTQPDLQLARAVLAVRLDTRTSITFGVLADVADDPRPSGRRGRLAEHAIRLLAVSVCDDVLSALPTSIFERAVAEQPEGIETIAARMRAAATTGSTVVVPHDPRIELREEVLLCLKQPVTAFTDAVTAPDAHEARRLRARVEAAWRLMDDLGWHPQDPRHEYRMTMPVEQLALALLWLHEMPGQDVPAATQLLDTLAPEIVEGAATWTP